MRNLVALLLLLAVGVVGVFKARELLDAEVSVTPAPAAATLAKKGEDAGRSDDDEDYLRPAVRQALSQVRIPGLISLHR